MSKDNTKNINYNFLNSHSLGALSYASADGNPHSAVVEYAVTKKNEILFNTFKSKRKYKFLLKNNKVAFVVGWD